MPEANPFQDVFDLCETIAGNFNLDFYELKINNLDHSQNQAEFKFELILNRNDDNWVVCADDLESLYTHLEDWCEEYMPD